MCESEIRLLAAPRYDLHRLGFFFTPAPRHADLLMVTGPAVRAADNLLLKAYNATPDPKAVIAVGACALGGFYSEDPLVHAAVVPVASVGGHDTAFDLSEGQWIANGLDRITGLKRKLRGSRLPIVLGFPFGLTIETIPTHLPLPAKIRTELLDPIRVDHDPERVNDRKYVNSIYREVESAIQDAMNRLAKQRRFPIFG